MGIVHIDFIAYAVYGEVLHNTSLVDVADTRIARSHLLPYRSVLLSSVPYPSPHPPSTMPQIHVTPEQARSLPVYV